jgi:hypothetical protein
MTIGWALISIGGLLLAAGTMMSAREAKPLAAGHGHP